MRIFSDTALLKFGILEFDFDGEEGTGIGPTLEFYSLISKNLRNLDIWRNDGDKVGLFPAPIETQNPEFLSGIFTFMGKFVAKALLDHRLVDLPFSVAFWKLVLKKPLSIFDIQYVDSEFGRHIKDL